MKDRLRRRKREKSSIKSVKERKKERGDNKKKNGIDATESGKDDLEKTRNLKDTLQTKRIAWKTMSERKRLRMNETKIERDKQYKDSE